MTISATTRGLRPGVCTSTTRPGSPFDGQLIYETDTNRVAVYDTNTWVYKTPASTTGSVLQVVSTTKTDTFTSSSLTLGTATDITGLSATITPSSTSSKILVVTNVNGAFQYVNQPYYRMSIQCKRDSTVIAIGDSAGSRTRVSAAGGMGGYYNGMTIVSLTHLDSPASTSALVYQVQVVNATYETASGVAYVNRNYTDTDANYTPRTVSSITVMEIAG